MTQGPSLALTTFQGSVPFLEPLPRDPCLIAFPSFLPDYLWVFLTVLVIQTLSASFQLVFNPGSSIHGDSLGKDTGVGCHALLPTQGSMSSPSPHAFNLSQHQGLFK